MFATNFKFIVKQGVIYVKLDDVVMGVEEEIQIYNDIESAVDEFKKELKKQATKHLNRFKEAHNE